MSALLVRQLRRLVRNARFWCMRNDVKTCPITTMSRSGDFSHFGQLSGVVYLPRCSSAVASSVSIRSLETFLFWSRTAFIALHMFCHVKLTVDVALAFFSPSDGRCSRGCLLVLRPTFVLTKLPLLTYARMVWMVKPPNLLAVSAI